MKRGCADNLLFLTVLVLAFAGSAYFWFNFFVRGKSLPTPDLIGKSVVDARAICSDLGVTLNVDPSARRNSDKVPAGHIVWQNRTPGTTNLIKRGTNIRVQLSAGPLVLRVPDLSGQSAGTAVLRLSQQNLRMSNFAYAEVPPVTGIVAADPPVGTVVAAQTPVSFLVSVPPPPRSFIMPDLIDHSLEEVRPYLEGHGLKISTVKFEEYPGISDGIIIRQFPVRGAPVSARDAISVVVSKREASSITEQPPPQKPLLGVAPTTTQ
jgi:beta-lactam-binding protein with PASTA domain